MFDLVVELVTVRAEELDSVIGVRVVRGGDDDPGIGSETARHISHSGRRQWANEQDIHAHGKDSRRDGIFEHVAREPCIFSENDSVTAPATRLTFKIFENV